MTSSILRNDYLNRITSRLNRGMIIILVGQRRVGKSHMLCQTESWIKDNIEGANIVYISKELQAFRDITDARELYDYAVARLPEGAPHNYLLIDEVQEIEEYEDALRSLHAENRYQIIATGSNAYIFSTELSARFSGRYIEIPVHSLTYSEFLQFHSLEDCDESLHNYLRVGGLPGLRHFDISDESQVRDYLQGVYNTIMMRDVIAREQIRNVTFIENLAHFIADNIGKMISIRNISNFMRSQGDSGSEPLIASYIKYLSDALIIKPVTRYDLHGKRLFEHNFKYYFSDHRLRNGEIDFVATKGSATMYIQATYLLGSEETVQREFGNLQSIKDNYPKYVVSMDPVAGELPEYPGIQHISLRKFLATIF